ncbi:hypothetical protein NN561_007725 [Cricetulus griseus]
MCLLDEGSQEGACGSGSSQENEQQPLESGHQGMGDSDGVPHTSMAACVPAPMQLNQQLGPLATAEAGECSPVYSPHHCRSMKLLLAQEERNEEESGHGEPATQGESERGLSGEGHSAAAASGLVDDDMNKDGGGARAGQESEQQPNEPIPGGMDGETVQSVPRQVPRRRLHHRFTQWQLEELERIFQTNCFFSIEARSQEDRGTSGGEQNEGQPWEPFCEVMGVAENVQPVSVLVRQRCFHYKFTQWQLQELERFFQQSHYISAEVRTHSCQERSRAPGYIKPGRHIHRADVRRSNPGHFHDHTASTHGSGQTGIPKASLAQTPELPLGCKQKRRGGGSTIVPKKIREGGESAQDSNHIQGKGQPGHDGWNPPSQSKIPEAPGGQAEAKDQAAPSRTAGLSDAHLSQGQGGLGKTSEGKCAGEKESSEDKSSSLHSDEDLDMAIKDLLRSKRRFKKRCREPRAVCKKVRFGATETRCGEKLSSLPGDWKDHGQQALRSCLFKCRGDNKDSPGRSPVSIFSSAAKRAKLGGTGGEDASPALLPRKKSPEGTPPTKDTGVSGCPSSASSPLSEDSSVDSDDSIELGIRKFLSEKAKESVCSSEPQGGPAKPEMPCRKELTTGLQPGVCTQSQKARGTPQLAEGRRGTERSQTQAASLLSQTGKGTLRAEQDTCLPTALGRSQPALPRNTSRNNSTKVFLQSRKSASINKEQSPRGTQTAVAESIFGSAMRLSVIFQSSMVQRDSEQMLSVPTSKAPNLQMISFQPPLKATVLYPVHF